MEVWQTSNLRRLRLGEERKKEEEEKQTTALKYIWSALFHRATINEHISSEFRARLQRCIHECEFAEFLPNILWRARWFRRGEEPSGLRMGRSTIATGMLTLSHTQLLSCHVMSCYAFYTLYIFLFFFVLPFLVNKSCVC